MRAATLIHVLLLLRASAFVYNTRPAHNTKLHASVADAVLAVDALIQTPTQRFEAAALLLVASFASKVSQSPLQRPKARVKPANVTKAAWRKGEIARWRLEESVDFGFAVAFLNEWATRSVEVGFLRARARCAPLDNGVRVLWASRGPRYLSAAEERTLEADFERLPSLKRDEADRAKSTYQYAARAAKSQVGGVDVLFLPGDGAEPPTLSVVRCGYATDEVVKEGSERALQSGILRDLPCAFGAMEPVRDDRPPPFTIDKYGRRTEN